MTNTNAANRDVPWRAPTPQRGKPVPKPQSSWKPLSGAADGNGAVAPRRPRPGLTGQFRHPTAASAHVAIATLSAAPDPDIRIGLPCEARDFSGAAEMSSVLGINDGPTRKDNRAK